MPLGPGATCGDYVHDFVHSKNKVFSGDLKKKRIRRALGACYKRKNEALAPDAWKADQKDYNSREERAQIKYKHDIFMKSLKKEKPLKKVPVKKEEALDEISSGLLARAANRASQQAKSHKSMAGISFTQKAQRFHQNYSSKKQKQSDKFAGAFTKKVATEETKVNELRLMKHIKLAGKDHIKKKNIDKWAPHKQNNPPLGNYKTEEILNELDPKTLHSYTKKAIKSVRKLDMAPTAGSLKSYFRKRDNRMKGIQRASQRLSKEEENLGEMENKKKGKLLYLVRHGKTAMNAGDNSVDRIRGWQDIPLDNIGRTEAKKTAQDLKSKGICAIISSDLVRASETAKIIGKALGLKPTYTTELRPWKLGNLQGQRTDGCLEQIKSYIRKSDVKVPGGESFNQFKTRALKGIENALKVCPGPVAIITHHRLERLMTAWTKAGQNNDKIDPEVFDVKGAKPGDVIKFNMTNFTSSLKPINEAEIKVKVKVKVKTGEGKDKKVKVTKEEDYKYLTLKDIFDTGDDDGTVL